MIALDLSKFLYQFQDIFIDDIPGELSPKRGDEWWPPPYPFSHLTLKMKAQMLLGSLRGV